METQESVMSKASHWWPGRMAEIIMPRDVEARPPRRCTKGRFALGIVAERTRMAEELPENKRA